MSVRQMIPVDDITIDTTQARRGVWEKDELDEMLINSIKGIGLIYDCIVRPTTSPKYGGTTDKPYALVAGSRRYHAMIEAGMYEIPCRVLELNDLEAIALSFNENVGRKDLTSFQRMIAILTWSELLKRAGKSEREAILEIANSSYGGETADIYRVLRTAELPKELHILIKSPEERTEEEKHILEERNISPTFRMSFTVLSAVKGVFDQLEEFQITDRIDKLFSIITDFELDEKKDHDQRDIFVSIREKLEEGKTFEIVMSELKEEMKIFTMLRVKAIQIRIPPEYDIWHRRACARANLEGVDLVRSVYLDWLEIQAKKEGW